MCFSQEKTFIAMLENHKMLHIDAIDAHEAFNIQALKLIIYV